MKSGFLAFSQFGFHELRLNFVIKYNKSMVWMGINYTLALSEHAENGPRCGLTVNDGI
ncbi:hypothetical protein AGR7B_Lc30073 [Agrobacterium deltaense RV3]|nr:hypothetical protein AGR7B_Lc30073 [Agrobacterium deltaense RV3]